MIDFSRRDLFAALADTSWMRTATDAEMSSRTGVQIPPGNPTPQSFYDEVEVKYRWQYADRMLGGK